MGLALHHERKMGELPMSLAPQEQVRKGLLPKWVRFFAWIFLVMGSAMPALLVSGTFYPSPMQFSLFGWEHSGSPYDAYSLLVVAYFIASGVAAFGMLWGRRWGWAAGFSVGSVGLLLALGSMFIRPLLLENDDAYTVYIRLEPLFQIAFLYALWRIRKSWSSPSAVGGARVEHDDGARKFIAVFVSATSVLVFVALALVIWLTSGLIEVAGRFFEEVKADDVAKARSWLSSEAQATTDDYALRQFLIKSEVVGFKNANWPVRQILGKRGELRGTITTANGEVPMVLNFVKEEGQWKIQHLSRPPDSAKPEEIKALRALAVRGDADAQLELGEKYLVGNGVGKNGAEAAKWFLKAAEQGSAKAQFDLGIVFEQGLGVEADKAEALKWYLKSAQQGFAKAQHNLAYNLAQGEGVEHDYAQAVGWYRKAATQGFVDSQLNLGVLYSKGVGVPHDDAEAVAWYRKAAAQGSAEAYFDLGDAYANGRGVQKDEVAAVEWYRKGADQGLAKAQHNLAISYSEGTGIPKSDKEAYFWWLLSARADKQKRAQLGEARAPLTPEEVSEVEERAAKWQPKAVQAPN